MHRRSRSHVTVFIFLGLALLLTGCPKRPAMTQVAAPPPAAPTPAPPAPAPPPPAPPPPVATPAPPAPAPTPPAPDYQPNPALKSVYFAFDSNRVRPGDAKTLDASVDWLKANPNQLVRIDGNCDERGTNEYNLALGERRAKAAMSYLVSKGIAADRIIVVSYGKERPVCTEHNESCWARNRRDDFLTKPR
jgi:peptidoglycan-associated lipoprotein